MAKTKEVIENPWADYFKKADEEKAEAEILYQQITEEDKNKTYLDILPAGFKNFKRSILKRQVMFYLDKVAEILNTTSIYEGRVFDKKEIVRYMMRGTSYSNFYLAYKFIPKKTSDSLWMKYAGKHNAQGQEQIDALWDSFEAENKDILKEYQKLENALQCLTQVWEQYESRLAVQNGTHDRDIEKDGYPRTGRGNMCYSFIPVRGKYPKNKKGTFELYNPRTKKDVTLTILGYKKEDEIYKCLTEEGKEVFLDTEANISNAYSDLHDSNKEIYAGWWNRTLISREK
jgi:hypothetical protein